MKSYRNFALLALALLAPPLGNTCSAALPTAGTFQLDPTGADTAKLGYYPVRIKLLDTRPAGVTKEPAYAATPKYGVFTVGNGPRSLHYLAVDEPATGTWRIFVDATGDGDLNSAGDGAWTKRRTTANGRVLYGVNPTLIRASYGTPQEETSAADYGLAFYRFAEMDCVLMYRRAVRTGTITVDGRSHQALLAENDGDALFSKPLDDDEKPVSGTPSHPVWLIVDLNDSGKWGPPIDVRSPFKLGGEAYVAELTPDGSAITFTETTRKVPLPKAAQTKPLLPAGTPAPDFAAEAWGGGTLRLSDYLGKIVILDFWATWSGPCQSSMLHIEQIYQATKAQDVVVLGVCVWDDRESYLKWVPEKETTFHCKFAFDPAGKDTVKGIASAKYNVSGIPTTYLIGKDGKVAATVVGYQEGDQRIEAELGKLGVSTQLPVVEMTGKLMERLIEYTRGLKDHGSVSSKIGKILELCDGTNDLSLKLAKSDSTDGDHYFGLPLDAESGDILFIVKHGETTEAYLTDKNAKLRAAAVLENGAARLVMNEKAEEKFRAELTLFAGEAFRQLPVSSGVMTPPAKP